MDFKEMYIKGMLELQRQKQDSDSKRGKVYRGGNAGVLHNGMPANSLPDLRVDMRRLHGIPN